MNPPGGLPSRRAGTASPSCPAHCPCLSRWSPTRQDGGGAGPIGVPNGSNGDRKAAPVNGTLPQRNFCQLFFSSRMGKTMGWEASRVPLRQHGRGSSK